MGAVCMMTAKEVGLGEDSKLIFLDFVASTCRMPPSDAVRFQPSLGIAMDGISAHRLC
jgi:hypothetical protein